MTTYIKWEVPNTDIFHVGEVITKTDTKVAFKTSYGTFDLYLTDGVFIDITEEEYHSQVNIPIDLPPVPEKETTVKKETKRVAKSGQSNKSIVKELVESNSGKSKSEMIDLIMSTLSVTKSNASVYYYNATK